MKSSSVKEPASTYADPAKKSVRPPIPEYRAVARRVGWVLLAGGLIDIAYMIYCVTDGRSYASQFNIFAVITAIFLFKGKLKTCLHVSWAAAFYIASVAGGLVVIFFLYPLDLLMAYAKLYPGMVSTNITIVAAILFVATWAYRQLTSPTIRAAMDEAGVNYNSFWRRSRRGFWFGGGGVFLSYLLLHFTISGPAVEKATQLAAEQAGVGYKFAVTSVNRSSMHSQSHVVATVTAYNDEEIREITVDWSE